MRRVAGVIGLVLVPMLALVACSAETDPASDVNYDRAKLRGVVRWGNGDGPGRVWWEYRKVGTQPWLEQSERMSWPRMTGSGSAAVEKTLTGLVDATSYEYRICSSLDSVTAAVCYDRDGSASVGAWDRFATVPHPRLTPRAAFALNDSVGVATHPTHYDTVHAQENAIAQKIADAGIRHVRNSMAISTDPGWNQIVWANMSSWPNHGIVSSWRVDRCAVTSNAGHTVRMYLDKIADIDGDLSSAIEGTNEVNVFCSEDWVNRERLYVPQLFQGVNSHPDPVIQSLPVLGPTFVRAGSSEIGDISQWIDFGNTHPYSGCTSPTPQHVQRYGIDDYAPAGGTKPIIATEVGFHTAVGSTEPGIQPPCDERTAGVYTLRAVLEHFNLGIMRSYLYEAIDPWPNPQRDRSEWNFGILRNDFSAKPAYTYVKNLLATTSSPNAATLTPLKVKVDQGPPDLRTLLLRQADGDYLLALWRHASVWNPSQRQPIPVPPARVTVSLPTASSVAKVQPHQGTAETPMLLTDRRVTLDVGGDAILLVIR
jgi:hypothetical protein